MKQRRSEAEGRRRWQRYLRWRSEAEVLKAIAQGRLQALRTCNRCANFDGLLARCPFVGQTEPLATCALWDDE